MIAAAGSHAKQLHLVHLKIHPRKDSLPLRSLGWRTHGISFVCCASSAICRPRIRSSKRSCICASISTKSGTSPEATESCTGLGKVVKVCGLRGANASLNGLYGTVVEGCSQDATRSVRIHKLGVCICLEQTNLRFDETDAHERGSSATALIRDSRIYEAQQIILGSPAIPRAGLEQEISRIYHEGYHCEIINESLVVSDIPGKGKGYVTSKDIEKGQVLLFEIAFCSAESDGSEHMTMLQQCVQKKRRCPELLSQMVMTLDPGSFVDDDAGEQGRLLSILRNNTFNSRRDFGAALFIGASRFNHSCCPNAFVDCSSSQLVVRALTKISAGAEVCISYLPCLSARLGQRRSILESGWGFHCECARCKQEEHSAKEDFSMMFSNWAVIEELDAEIQMECPDGIGTEEELERWLGRLAPIVTESLAGERLSHDRRTIQVPSTCTPMLNLMSNLADLYLVLAQCLPLEADRQACVESWASLRQQVLAAWAARHGSNIFQRELAYILQLESDRDIAKNLGSNLEEDLHDELSRVCLLQYGQPCRPEVGEVFVA